MFSLEDLVQNGMMEQKEPLIVGSRKELRKLCEEWGIANQRMIGNQFSAIVTFLKRGDKYSMECVERIITEAQQDKGVTYL